MVIISRRRDKSFRGFRIGAKGTSVVPAPRHLGAHAMYVRLGVGVFPYVVVGVEEDVRFVIRHPLDVLPGEVLLVCGVERVHHTDLRDPLRARYRRPRHARGPEPRACPQPVSSPPCSIPPCRSRNYMAARA